MTTASFQPGSSDDQDRIKALIRNLTNLANQSERHHRQHTENNRLNGVLLEDVEARLDRIEEMQKRIYVLGMFWSEEQG